MTALPNQQRGDPLLSGRWPVIEGAKLLLQSWGALDPEKRSNGSDFDAGGPFIGEPKRGSPVNGHEEVTWRHRVSTCGDFPADRACRNTRTVGLASLEPRWIGGDFAPSEGALLASPPLQRFKDTLDEMIGPIRLCPSE